ncbi:flagellar motor switch protein FliN [Limnochorda pilosa]|uniref:Flagellar motor switch protein FliN-like C-terminal domain-containing protein n=1 Tax=Limnochorda pilosa TaxID=1555112 RepID=A0A0K2SK69_LIMPI|nr:flagellar motor switch protein FliN [Limnochorda pilosa]BAS27511.1 hypothetical protein LIP_1665 [Limnochorda pilosa]
MAGDLLTREELEVLLSEGRLPSEPAPPRARPGPVGANPAPVLQQLFQLIVQRLGRARPGLAARFISLGEHQVEEAAAGLEEGQRLLSVELHDGIEGLFLLWHPQTAPNDDRFLEEAAEVFCQSLAALWGHPVEIEKGAVRAVDLSEGLPEGLLPFGRSESVWSARLAVGVEASPLVFWLPRDVALDLRERLERSADVGGGLAPPRERVSRSAQGGVRVEPARFSPLRQPGGQEGERDLGRVMDLPLEVTVELGRAQLKVREILDLKVGTVVELDRLAGEPVDLRVNGRLVAKGEVVVVDESFAVKITQILAPEERAPVVEE